MIHRLLARLHDSEIWSSYLPHVPRRLYPLGLAGLLLAAWSAVGRPAGATLARPLGMALGGALMLPAAAAGAFGLWKWRSRVGVRNQILDLISWRGDEQVLDVGCGSGLLLNGAARRLRSGRATGIDIWAPASGGGSLDQLWRSARAERVADRIAFKEADARQMPFADGEFDVVLSSGALHHICRSRADHEQVVGELARVLRPGGQIVLWDITHMIEATAARLRQAGLSCEARPVGHFLGFDMSVLSARKPG